MTPKELSDIRRKLKVLNYAKEIGNAAAACRHFGISGESFYKWKRAYERDGESALINSKPLPAEPEAAHASPHRGENPVPAAHLPPRPAADSLVIYCVTTTSKSLPARCAMSSCAMA
jgi:hypothetical protein